MASKLMARRVSSCLISCFARGVVWRVPCPQPVDFKQELRGLGFMDYVPLSRRLSRKLSRWFVIVSNGLGGLSRCPATLSHICARTCTREAE